MLKLADIGFFVWLIVVVLAFVAKSWNKMQQQIDKDTSESKPPSAARPPRPQRPRPTFNPIRPQRTPPSLPRMIPPTPRAGQRTAPPPVGTPTWRVDPEQIRRFVEQLSGKPQDAGRAQAPAAPPPIAHPAFQPSAPETADVATEATVPEPAAAKAPESAPATTSRASQWAEALRDQQNIRNIIVSAEIIGPPISLR